MLVHNVMESVTPATWRARRARVSVARALTEAVSFYSLVACVLAVTLEPTEQLAAN